ncbi:porphobilinogen synthase [Hoyosella altamirensis]|uniref:Delta-aminolevulinic acid dehydratase n=1 Tax=Hoyosella altamirensis TaxID=616997 RepID=A0A839RMQ6_9ACTN|nr:porphobilinogen synthase [Hoyosella altamirensis]MBB3037478.1 porphobilinogen synthase [Hoyosella altamirensis]
MFPAHRPRRLRTTPAMRRLTAEVQVNARDLVLPMFVADEVSSPRPISSMPGVYQHTLDSLRRAAADAVASGVGGVMLFGVPDPDDKDPQGRAGIDPEGVLNRALRALRGDLGDDTVIMADTCLDEFTDHGHCGVVAEDGSVDNDATLDLYQQMAVVQAEAGAHVVSPSGMMDGQVAAIRSALDTHGKHSTAILAYSAKYSSALYGPFREAVGSSLHGTRASYQQDCSNVRESRREISLDLEEGADMVMVKPAMLYLDVVRETAELSDVPVAAYQVSGEYSMISAAAERGWIDRDRGITESLTSIKRAGADFILTYFADVAIGLLDR